jgi:hypothetical protein
MLRPGLTALEVVKKDFRYLDATVAQYTRQIHDLTAPLEPRAGEGVPEPVRSHMDVGQACILCDTAE